MFANLIENLSDGTADQDFDLIGTTSTGSLRRDVSSPLDQPRTLKIEHTESGSGVSRVRRSVYRLDSVEENSEGEQGTTSVYLVVVAPVKVTDTTKLAKNVTLMKSFLAATGHVDKIVAGEV